MAQYPRSKHGFMRELKEIEPETEIFMPEIPFFIGESKRVIVNKHYRQPPLSVKETARFFERTTSWVREILKEYDSVLVRPDKSKIVVPRQGNAERRIFTLELIRDIAQALYDANAISKAHYNLVARRVNAFYFER